MISRKDNLLIKPWQQRKFEHHRRKVKSALPAIDTNPPAYRGHVAIKLKKQQKEDERCRKIERDNYLLLQKMKCIMRTSRIDNVWRTPQPNFLNKIAIYSTVVPKVEEITFALEESENETRNRKSNCYACKSLKNEENVFEKSVPGQPKKKIMPRVRSKSEPLQKSEPLPTITEQAPHDKNNPIRAKTSRSKTSTPFKIEKEIKAKEPHSIILSRGCLKLSVNFPSDTVVKFQKGNIEKILLNELCHCKSSLQTTVSH